jgi:hypothetical protein
LIRVRRTSDTARLRIVIPGIRPGSYRVSWSYEVDTLDRTSSLRTDTWLTDTAGRRSGNNVRRLESGRRVAVQSTLEATEAHRRMVISLAGYGKDMTTPNITVDSLRVVWLPPEEEAVWRLQRSWYGGGGVIDSLFPHKFDKP